MVYTSTTILEKENNIYQGYNWYDSVNIFYIVN